MLPLTVCSELRYYSYSRSAGLIRSMRVAITPRVDSASVSALRVAFRFEAPVFTQLGSARLTTQKWACALCFVQHSARRRWPHSADRLRPLQGVHLRREQRQDLLVLRHGALSTCTLPAYTVHSTLKKRRQRAALADLIALLTLIALTRRAEPTRLRAAAAFVSALCCFVCSVPTTLAPRRAAPR